MAKTYSEKLKDPRWQKLRLKVFERDDFACTNCGSPDNTLHAHHKYYESGKEPWEYPNESIVTLCEDCHEQEELELKEYSTLLIDTIKRSPFMADDMRELASGISEIKMQHLSRVVASAYAYAFRSPEMQSLIIETYFKSLK